MRYAQIAEAARKFRDEPDAVATTHDFFIITSVDAANATLEHAALMIPEAAERLRSLKLEL